jgi:hypothetical protein
MSPEIYEKVNINGRGAIVVFAAHAGNYDYISRNTVSRQYWHSRGVEVRRDDAGRAMLRCHFTGAGAKIIFFGINK